MVRKYVRRLFCLLLAAVMVGALIPARASAEEVSPQELKSKLSRMYQQVLQIEQRDSLNGLCATLVTWELYIAGINREFVGGDGNDQFDNYRNEKITTGGYYIHALPATEYTLEEALLTITDNGTRNAYNILIGFERTRTAAGAKFGHTVFIGGIIDGMVYYVESDDYSVGGATYSAGRPIVVPISTFAERYSGWAVFEGAIAFTQERYLDSCQVYPTDLYIQAAQPTELWTEPCDGGESVWSEQIRQVREGEVFRVDGIYLTPEGEYWYRMADAEDRFLPAEDTLTLGGSFDRVTVSDILAPGILEQGQAFELGGAVESSGSEIRTVRCQIFSESAGAGVLLRNAMEPAQAQRYEIGDNGISQQLSFGDLEPGDYHYVISAAVCNNYLDDGQIKRYWDLKNLWTSDFQVVENGETAGGLVVSLEPNGGSAPVDQTVVPKGALFSEVLTPERPGYRFDGWYQEVDGVVRGPFLRAQNDLPVYAEWKEDTEGFEGWHLVDGRWRFYRDGQAVSGLVEWDGIWYYFREDGSLHTGWLQTEEQTFYFFENGASASGRLTVDGREYIFAPNGAVMPVWLMS